MSLIRDIVPKFGTTKGPVLAVILGSEQVILVALCCYFVSESLSVLFSYYLCLQVMFATYSLTGCTASTGTKRQFVDEVFANLDADEDGIVTKEQFLAFFVRISVSHQPTIF